MKLSSSSNIKKILIVFQKKAFLRFQEMEPCTFLTKLKDQKDPTPENFSCFKKRKPKQISYTSGNRNPEKTSYISLKRKVFLCFRKQKP